MAVTEEMKKKAYEMYATFAAFCRILFGDKPVKNINELTAESPFYKDAQSVVKDFELDWDNLTVEDSNEVILVLMDEYYSKIRQSDEYDYIIQIGIKEKQSNKKSK